MDDHTQSWFRLDPDGNVVGLAEGDRVLAEMNLGAGEYLMPADPAVNPRRDRWAGERWVTRAAAPRPEDDHQIMRRTGFPTLGEQIGVLMKIAAALVSGEPVDAATRAEFDALIAQIAAVKAAHPKPKTPAA
jgi:hypothetical protein